VLLGASAGEYSVGLLPDERSSDTPLKVLEFSGRDLTPLKLYIGPDNLIAKQAFTTAGPDGMPLQVEEVFSDYRTVNGVRVPFQAQLMQGGRPIMKRTLSSVTLNTPVADSLFDRPQ
jgi:hypothetical protein